MPAQTRFVIYRDDRREPGEYDTRDEAEEVAEAAYQDQKYDFPSESLWQRGRSYWRVEEEEVEQEDEAA